MKKILLLLSLLLATNAWADEDEFPMKLTCEWGADIVYVYVAEDIYKSWFQFHPSSASLWFKKWGTEKLFVSCGKRKRVREALCLVDKYNIKLIGGNNQRGIVFRLNRITNKLQGGRQGGGQCFKGFKEYK